MSDSFQAFFRPRGLAVIGASAILTFHPWEFDTERPPMEALDRLLRLIHFYNFRGLPDRFERWLASERRVALADVLSRLAT